MSLHRRRVLLLAKDGERGGFGLKDGDNDVEEGEEESMCGSAITGERRRDEREEFFFLILYLNIYNFCVFK